MVELFKGFNQFINWIPKPRENGKIDKVPIGIEGFKIDPHDPKNWRSKTDAENIAKHTGTNVGFVFTDKDPFFFVDIDNARIGEDWSPLAKNIISAFPGCAVEISQSGKGLHIFGTGDVGTHDCRNASNDLEFYTEKRFVALTGNGLIGDSAKDGTPGTKWLIKTYFSLNGASITMGWTDKPCVEWNGEIDDTLLLKRAEKDRRTSVVFGDKASFTQLFNGDGDKLGGVLPPRIETGTHITRRTRI